MNVVDSVNFPPMQVQPTLRLAADDHLQASAGRVSQARGDELRQLVGEFVGNVFYGTVFRQMQASKLKGKYMHGGRGEEIFQAQLGMELAKRMGRAASDPVANSLYESFRRHLEKSAAARQRLDAGQAPTKTG
jgi:hypothetical protein